MSLLPSSPDTSAAEEAAPTVVGVDSERADALMAALSSTTARQLLTALHHEPAAPSALADRVGTSLQNAQYHLERLADAGAIEVVDTVYSEKGREMDIYAPADRPLVIFAGREDQSRTLRAAIRELLPIVGVLAVASLAVQLLVGGHLSGLVSAPGTGDSAGTTPSGGTAGTPTAEALAGVGDGTVTQTTTAAAAEATRTAAGGGDLLGQLPPGLLFFVGGLAALLLVLALLIVRAGEGTTDV